MQGRNVFDIVGPDRFIGVCAVWPGAVPEWLRRLAVCGVSDRELLDRE